MAANDQIKCVARILRQVRSGARMLVVGDVDYTKLDETDPKTQVYIDGHQAPVGGGHIVPSSKATNAYNDGEAVVIQVKNRMGSNKTLDSTGSTSGLLILSVFVRDLATGEGFFRTLTEADRDTAVVPDDPTVVNGAYSDAYGFTVSAGERWQVAGLFQADFRTTA